MTSVIILCFERSFARINDKKMVPPFWFSNQMVPTIGHYDLEHMKTS